LNRPALVILALWASVAAPVLCTAGVLAHECECASGVVCEHETDCERDPCSEQLYRKDGSSGASVDGAAHDAPAACPVSAGIVARSAAAGPAIPSRPDLAPPPDVRHESDLPLLI
jgi:hypothetical protein